MAGNGRIDGAASRNGIRAGWLATVAAFAALSVAAAPGTATAAPLTLHVAATGIDSGDCTVDACATIQYAADRAVSGDTIEVGPGTYSETVKVRAGLDLRGPNAGIAADGARGAEAIVEGGANGGVVVSAAGASVDGFTIKSGGDGLLGSASTGLRVENDIVRSSQRRGAALVGGAANVTVEGSSIEGAIYGLVFGAGSYENLRIADNSLAVDDGNPEGYSLFNSGDGVFDGLDLSGNVASGAANLGGNVEGGQVSGNRFDAGGTGLALQIDLHDSTLSGNSFEGNGTAGCLQLFGNQYGLDPSADAIVAGNAFHGCNRYGIQLSAGIERISITGNTITDSYDGINTRLVENEAPWSVDGAGISIVGNRIVGISHRGIDNLVEGTLEASDNWWGCNAGPGLAAGNGCSPVSAGVQVAPWLVLTSSSPEAVRPGEGATVSTAIDTDSNGAHVAAVPDGTPVAYSTDLGALEPASATTVGGLAATRLTSAGAGTATVATTVDSQTVSSTIRIEEPPAPTPPAKQEPPKPSPAPKAPVVRVAGDGAPVQVSSAGTVTVASVACPEGSCRIAIKQRKITVGGRGFPLTLKLDKLIDAGESTAVTAVLPPKARRALAAAGKAQAVVRLRFYSGSGVEEIPVRVKLKAPESAR